MGCRHGNGSNFVSPPDCGDGVVQFVLYDLNKPQSSSSIQLALVDNLGLDEYGGFDLPLLDTLLSKGILSNPSLPNGKLSPPELQICLGKIGGELSLEEAEMAAALMDSDGDGLLSIEDLVQAVEGANEEEKVNDLNMAFKMYEEKEGCITPKSLRRMLSKLGESRTVNDCKVMIARFDVNGDGVLNFDEFRIMMA
ncbi:EF-hand domain pair [Artemisia annua]|uniref:EF-hand domain pair n=1 Tax=Artemisia annua TaxID=35608 RepID=A0A2U1KHQ9_ARTAN|nr:EF-hand domain pair [Artemisia annua]